MEIQEYLKYRISLLDEAKDEDGFINETSFIERVIPDMLDAKLIDTEDFTETFFDSEVQGSPVKINGYINNESGERLQLFILNSESIELANTELMISRKEYYDNIYKLSTNFINRAIKGHLNSIQDVGAIKSLVYQMSSSLGVDQFDVIEIFLISATATIENRGQFNYPKRIDFKDEIITVNYTKDQKRCSKEILIIKRLIDLNFLYNIMVSQGNREQLTINFAELFDYKIEAIKAADEKNFESYLCVLPATILSKLYMRYSSRLLEKNVRSFLQFRNKGVNAGMKKTLNLEPEKFIAYNNGLTITANDKIIEEIGEKYYIISLSDFQIVNGGQTTASIYFSQKEGINISSVKVMAKINITKDVSEDQLEELISNISQYSNSQIKVSSVDLRSRSPQLNQIKVLSDSVLTPSGRKWFFEKSKGEFNTMLRIAGKSSKARIENEYPQNFRFTKEQLGKYYCSWGNEPYKVKKGGEAIFRKFMEEITPSVNNKIVINRNFYELLIAKIILFKELEKIHGSGKSAIGQLRSAVVPYTLSILYSHTDGNKKSSIAFDLFKIWKNEGLENDLETYIKELMILVNALIRKYAKSDDYGEYSKKKELWDDIYRSEEIKEFLASNNSIKIFDKYGICKKELVQKHGFRDVDFKNLKDSIRIHANTADFYKSLERKFCEHLQANDKLRLQHIIDAINNRQDITSGEIEFENDLIHNIRMNKPEVFDQINNENNLALLDAFDYIVKKYNSCITKSEDIVTTFNNIAYVASLKGIKYTSVFNTIGEQLEQGYPPTTEQIYNVTNYTGSLKIS